MQAKKWVSSEFLKYIIVLMSGTVVAQILGYVFAPIITRLYTPEEAGELGLYLRVISLGAAIGTLRYEQALPILKADSHSFRLYKLSILFALIVSLVSILAIIYPLLTTGRFVDVVFYMLIPFGILLTAVHNLGTNWSIRMKKYKSITYARISNSLSANIFKVSFGFLGWGYPGLIVGTVLGLVLGNVWFFRDFFNFGRKVKFTYSSPRSWLLVKQYIEFPTINLPHAIMDLTRDLLIALIILWLFSKEDFGLFDHSYRMLRLPLIFVGMAIGQVFFQRCAEMINSNENIMGMIKKAVITLSVISIVPFSILFFYGEELFAFVFGENWRASGKYSEILVPMFMLNFISSPISSLPTILRRQRDFFKLALFGSIMMVLALIVPNYFFGCSIKQTLWALSISHTLYLIYVLFRIFRYVKDRNEQRDELLKS